MRNLKRNIEMKFSSSSFSFFLLLPQRPYIFSTDVRRWAHFDEMQAIAI